MKTELNNRTLWYDGSSVVNIDDLSSFIEQTRDLNHIFVNRMTPEIKQYNALVPKKDQLKLKENNNPFDLNWNIPDKYKHLDLIEYLSDKINSNEELSLESISQRISIELNLFKAFKMENVLRTIIYIVEKFEENNIVWGIGRGSSVSSYILYLIGIHDVNSLKYDLDPNDFFHD